MFSSKGVVGIPFRIERANIPYHVVTLQTRWQYLAQPLDVVRSLNIDVRKAFVTPSRTSLYLKDAGNAPLSAERKEDLAQQLILQMKPKTPLDAVSSSDNDLDLRDDVEILLYNLPPNPFTICEFVSEDRIGLLADTMNLLSQLPINIQMGHITTVGTQAFNVFHFTRRNSKQALTPDELLFVSNVFEFEGKKNLVRCISHPEY